MADPHAVTALLGSLPLPLPIFYVCLPVCALNLGLGCVWSSTRGVPLVDTRSVCWDVVCRWWRGWSGSDRAVR